MSTVLKLTVAEFDRMIERGAFAGLPKRIELIYGELREMNPAGPIHEDVISFLTRWSIQHTPETKVNVRVQCGLGLPQLSSVPEPDVAWVRRGRYRRRRPQAADVLLLIEVADSSLDYDLETKQEVYATAGVKEYWVVDAVEERVVVFRGPTRKGHRTTEVYATGHRLAPQACSDAVLVLDDLFAG